MVLDLRDEADAATFAALLGQADVLVENFTLGVAERLGFDAESLRSTERGIVSLYLNTFGRHGPWAAHRGYAELANIATGLTERTLGGVVPESGASVAADLPRWTFTDYLAGVLGAFGVVVALHDRLHTGEGRLVETSLVRATSLEQLLYVVMSVDAEGRVGRRADDAPEPRGREATGWCSRQRIYHTADGAIFLGATQAQLPAIAAALDVALTSDDDELADTLADAFASRTTDDAVVCVNGTGAAAHEITSVADVFRPGGVADRQGLRLVDETETFGTVVMPGPVVRFSRTPMRPGRFPGPFGADRPQILGYAREGSWR
jgi:crotonobetainyl-CoA:carnitine CoA-transferase CaiB-like acyl-CoA transferase